MNPTTDNDADDQLQHVDNPLAVMSPGERVICSIKRHPFGLIGIYLVAGLLLVLLFAGVAVLPHFVTTLSSQDKTYIFLGTLIFAVVVLLYMYVATTIYNGNRWIVTSDSITQVTQLGLFRKHTSQLSLENLEDVTFEQNSFVQTMFGFGTLKVETAGERAKFVFPFCPSPAQCAKDIIQAHDEYIELHNPARAQQVPAQQPYIPQNYPPQNQQ